MKPVFRLPPSPTGYLSMGNVRTFLFNYVCAKALGGSVLLRFEDTDSERSKLEYEDMMKEDLRWLGILWDNTEVPRQSDRKNIYRKYLEKMLEQDDAYYCFCKEEDLEKDRQAQEAEGILQIYRGPCGHIKKEEAEKRAKLEPAVIRFRMKPTVIEIKDLIRGNVRTDTSLIGDIIIAKNLDSALYNFAVIIDDYEFGITHVIRGEDHLSNTPKQWMIAESLKIPHPTYGHLPLILGPDKKKLSKRYLQGAVKDYRENGYLPEAIVNFLMFVGWHPKEDKDIMSLEEIGKEFTIERVQKSGAIFNPEKLDWYNSYYIKNTPSEKLYDKIKGFIRPEWWKEKQKMIDILSVEKSRLGHLKDLESIATPYFIKEEYSHKLLLWKEETKENAKKHLKRSKEIIEQTPPELFKEKIDSLIMDYANQQGRGGVLWPLRVALSGREKSAGPFDFIKVLGKHESLERIEKALILLDIND